MNKISIDSGLSAHVFANIREALKSAAPEAFAGKKKAVTRSAEFERISALPVRDPYAYGDALTDAVSSAYRKHRGARLFEAQAVALYEIAAFDGFIGNITMGGGKTLISLLACTGKRGLIVLPAKLIPKTRAEMRKYAKDWHIPGNITLISYERLSRVGCADFLEELKPEIVICDEGHRLKSPKTSVHRRMRRYTQKSKCTFVCFSGTLIGENLSGWAHLSGWALHNRSPAPLTWAGQAEWQAALTTDAKIGPGALRDFGEDFRDGYRVRMAYSPGFYVTRGVGVDNALEIERFETALSEPLQAAIKHLADTWELPTGETLTDPLGYHRAACQLELGGYSRWPEQPPAEWREARLDWSRAVREIIRYSRHLDSELAVKNLIDRGGMPDAKPVLERWRKLEPSFKPRTEFIWLDRDPVKQIVARARDGQTAIVWVHHTAIGAAFDAEGLAYYGAGGLNAKGEFIETATGGVSISASIESNAEGRNLQHGFGRSVIAELPRDPVRIEQLIARLHRPGQTRDTVEIEVNTSTDASRRAWLRVLERAVTIQKNSGQLQRLLIGTHVNPLSDEEIERLTDD